jgi:hypothetical protein
MTVVIQVMSLTNMQPIIESPESLEGTPVEALVTNTPEQQEHDKLMQFSQARIALKRLVDDWQTEVTKTQQRRDTRDVAVDVEALRRDGSIDEDETIIPVRIIDTNIQRELPPYINYLKNSRRLCTFNSLDVPNQDTQKIELDFTRGMTYLGWEIPHYKCLDGSMTHGWDAIEVVLDESKPLHVSHEHIGHDNLYFPRTNRDIQQAPRVIRAYDITIPQLKNFVNKFGFSQEQVNLIVEARKDTSKADQTVRCFKEFFKYQGSVWVAWFALEDSNGNGDWLKAPMPLSLGISEQVTEMVTTQVPHPLVPGMMVPSQQPVTKWKDKPVTQYPIFILYYRETEKPKITDHMGRVFFDESKQEAQTAILSGYVNGLTRASNVYASVGAEDGTGSSLKELNDVKLVGGRIFNKPLTFFHPDYPDPSVLKAMQWFDVANSQETNQPNFAASNRQDSRKTATEIDAANQQQQLLNSVQLALFSTHIRAIYSFSWLIVQSQALQNLIAFCRVAKQQPIANPALGGQPTVDPTTGQPVMQTIYVNDESIIKQSYDVRAAGDIDVVQRAEKLTQMKQDWPVIANTPLANRFLQDLVRLEYPDTGEEYAEIIGTGDQVMQVKQLAARLGMMMSGAIAQHPEMMQTLPPEQQQQLQQTLAMAKQVAASLQQPQQGGQQK